MSENNKIKTYPIITLHRGGASIINFDFSDFNFYNGYVIFTIKRKTNYDVIFEYKFEENKIYNVILDKKFTETLGYKTYLYDLVLVKDENYYPLCLPSEILVEEVVTDV